MAEPSLLRRGGNDLPGMIAGNLHWFVIQARGHQDRHAVRRVSVEHHSISDLTLPRDGAAQSAVTALTFCQARPLN